MGWTKQQFIEQAFSELGLAPYVFDATADQLQDALRMLDAMLATWNARGIRISYSLPLRNGTSKLDDDSGVPDSAYEAIYTNLAIRMAPSYGKVVSQETKQVAKEGYRVLLSLASEPSEMQFPSTLPLGAGNTYSTIRNKVFVYGPTDNIWSY